MHSVFLSNRLGAQVYLKLECLQKTGSFKPRGAFNKMLSLTEPERRRGVVAVSGGNHAQGVAFAARHLGIAATVVMPAGTPANYVDATRNYGAAVVLTPDIHTAFAEVDRLKAEGLVEVHPFDDRFVAAGQGTIGLEILEDLPDVSHLYVSIGGGGLITGVASAIRSIKPEVRVIGVETAGADAMSQSLAAGRLVELPAITSIARTLGASQSLRLHSQSREGAGRRRGRGRRCLCRRCPNTALGANQVSDGARGGVLPGELPSDNGSAFAPQTKSYSCSAAGMFLWRMSAAIGNDSPRNPHFPACEGRESRRGCCPCRSRTERCAPGRGRIRNEERSRSGAGPGTTSSPWR